MIDLKDLAAEIAQSTKRGDTFMDVPVDTLRTLVGALRDMKDSIRWLERDHGITDSGE